jgi:hypothetical protein
MISQPKWIRNAGKVAFGSGVWKTGVGPRLTKTCREFVQAANAAGGKAELTLLPDIGIHGNSHMLMQDKNSLTIADWLIGWINHHIGQKPK